MKKGASVSKYLNKGQSLSSMQPYHESRVTNQSNSIHKTNSKVSKPNSVVKLHQPLTIQNRHTLKQSKLQSSKAHINYQLQRSSTHKEGDLAYKNTNGQLPQSTNELLKSRTQIKSQLELKNPNNPVSFRQTGSTLKSLRTKQTKDNFNPTQAESRLSHANQTIEKQNKALKQQLYRLRQSSLEDKQKIKTLITRMSEIKREKKISQTSTIALMSKSKTTASYANIIKTRTHTDRQHLPSSHIKSDRQNIPFSQLQQEVSTPFKLLQPSSHRKGQLGKQACNNQACEQRRKHLQGQLYKERIQRDQLEQQKGQWQKTKHLLKQQYQDLLSEIQLIKNDSLCQQ